MSHGFDSWALSLVTFLPVVGAVLLAFIPKAEEEMVKIVALVTAVATAAVMGWVLSVYDYGGKDRLHFEVDKKWIEVINSRFHIGVEGLGLPLLALSCLIVILCIV